LKQERQHFATMVVDAVSYLDIDLPLNMIGVKKVSGGSIKVNHNLFGILFINSMNPAWRTILYHIYLTQDSRLVKGVAFKKAFSYAGFEMQPKHYKNPLIAILNIELELKAEKDNAELRIANVADYQEVRELNCLL
jgi:T-complex protein 1 subunit eta